MKSSPDLHRLIRSMTMSEKRYFRLFSQRNGNGRDNNYIRLFDAIEGQPEYDERSILLQFEKEPLAKHFPSEKNYLYHQVLDSLNHCHRNRTFLSRYASLLVSVELLYSKGLFDQCLKLIRQARKEAYSLEKISILLLLKRWETIIYIKDEDEKKLNENIEEEIRLLEVLQLQYILTRIAFNIQVTIDKGRADETFLRQQDRMLEKHFHGRPGLGSFWSKYYYYSGKGLIASARKDHLSRYESYLEIRSIMDSAPQFITDLPAIYHLNTNNLINVMFLLGKLREVEDQVINQKNFMELYGVRNPTLSRIVKMNAWENELFLYYLGGRWDNAAALIQEAEPVCRKTPDTFSPLLFDLLYVMSICAFMTRNYNGATRFLNRILNAERNVNFRPELRINARLLYLLVLQATGDVLFDTRLNASRRYLAQETSFRMQKSILEAIALLESTDLQLKKEQLRKLIRKIELEKKKAPEEATNKQFDFAGYLKGFLL